jgi:tetratricopeptide (TPR) repeat protein
LSHVFVIEAARHRIPRWFTEGVAVHEETAASPEWGDRLSPMVLKAVKEKCLLPVAELDRGFIRPVDQSQIMVSYFQAGRMIDYIVQRWSWDKVLDMIPRFANLRPVSEVIPEVLGLPPKAFDEQFLAWLEKQHAGPLKEFDTLQTRLKSLNEAGRAKKWDEVLRDGPALRDAYPELVDHGSAYEWIAAAHEERKDRDQAIAELRRYRSAGGRDPALLKKLAGWLAEKKEDAEAIATFERINLIYPVRDEDLHRRLGELYQRQNRWREALVEYRSWVSSNPVDPAAAHYHLALALRAEGRAEDARNAVLQALESAPTYRPAQRLLLELTGNEEKKK